MKVNYFIAAGLILFIGIAGFIFLATQPANVIVPTASSKPTVGNSV